MGQQQAKPTRKLGDLNDDEKYFIVTRIMSSRCPRYYNVFRGLYPQMTFMNSFSARLKRHEAKDEEIESFELYKLYNKIKTPVEKLYMLNSDIYEDIISFLINDPHFYPTFGKYLCLSKTFTSLILNAIRKQYLKDECFIFYCCEFVSYLGPTYKINYRYTKMMISKYKNAESLKDCGYGFLDNHYNLEDPEHRKKAILDIRKWENDHKSYYSIYQIYASDTPVLQLDEYFPYFELQE
jgi:hypothetical protein